jgi:hypothetical protein
MGRYVSSTIYYGLPSFDEDEEPWADEDWYEDWIAKVGGVHPDSPYNLRDEAVRKEGVTVVRMGVDEYASSAIAVSASVVYSGDWSGREVPVQVFSRTEEFDKILEAFCEKAGIDCSGAAWRFGGYFG